MSNVEDRLKAKSVVSKDAGDVNTWPEEKIIEEIKKNPKVIIDVENPTKAMKMAAVTTDGLMLEFIKGRDSDIINAALDQNALALQFVLHQRNYWQRALKKDPAALQYVIHQTSDMCEDAVKRDPDTLQYVEDQSWYLCHLAVSIDGSALQHVREQTDILCYIAIEKDYENLQYVHNQTEELCRIAVNKDTRAIKFIRDVKMIERMRNIYKK